MSNLLKICSAGGLIVTCDQVSRMAAKWSCVDRRYSAKQLDPTSEIRLSCSRIINTRRRSHFTHPLTKYRGIIRYDRASSFIEIVCAIVWILPSQAQRQSGGNHLPLFEVLSTGGTIAGKSASSTNLTEYKAGSLSGEDLVKAAPEIRQYANVRVERITNVSSSDISIANWITLANRINQIFAQDSNVRGIVITHGTNILEETAYFLNLTVKDDRPVVLVGAMRPSTALSADGPLNLLNAIRVASSVEARGKGVLIVMNDEIHRARDVTKTNTYRVETSERRSWDILGMLIQTKSLSTGVQQSATP